MCPIARLLSDLLAQHLDFGVSDCFPGFGNSLVADTAQGTTFSLGDPLESNGNKHLDIQNHRVGIEPTTHNEFSGRLSRSIALRQLKASTFLRLCFGHQQGKEDESAESNRCQGDETDGVTEHLYDKARTEVT